MTKGANVINFAVNELVNDAEFSFAIEVFKEDNGRNYNFLSAYDFKLYQEPNYEARILAALKDKTEKLTFIIVNGENIQGSEDPEQNEKFINSELKKQLCQNCSICSNCRNQKRSQIEKLQAAGRGHWSLLVYHHQNQKFFHLDSSTKKLHNNPKVGGERIIKPFLEHFQNKLEAGGNKTVNFEDINERPTQPPGSQSCGFYVLYYIKKLIESSDLLETGIPSVENLVEQEAEWWQKKFKDDTGTAIVGEEKEAEIKNQEEVLRFRRFRFPGEQTRESLQAESSTTVAKGKSTKLMETESSEGEFESDDDLDGVLEEVLHKPYCGEDNCRRIYSSLQEKENELISLRSICGSLQEENNNLQAIKIAAADHENAAREAKEKINSLSSEIKALQSSNSTLQQEKAQKETEIVRLNKEKKDQQKQINSLQTEKSQLTWNEENKAKDANNIASQLRTENAELKNGLENLQKQLRKWQIGLGSLSAVLLAVVIGLLLFDKKVEEPTQPKKTPDQPPISSPKPKKSK